MHATPTQKQMSGIEIHAHALSTILNRNYLDTVGTFGNLAIAFALCFILAMIHLRLPAEFKSLALRLIQLILLYFIIRIGYYFFIYNRKNETCNFQKRNEQIFSFFASFFLLLFRPLKHQLKADFKPLKQA